MQGFSPRNLKNMRALAQAWPTPAIVQRAVAQLPWSHIVTLLDKLKKPDARNWYAAQSLEHGWSRNVLAMQIDTHAYSRAGAAITNFDARLLKGPEDQPTIGLLLCREKNRLVAEYALRGMFAVDRPRSRPNSAPICPTSNDDGMKNSRH